MLCVKMLPYKVRPFLFEVFGSGFVFLQLLQLVDMVSDQIRNGEGGNKKFLSNVFQDGRVAQPLLAIIKIPIDKAFIPVHMKLFISPFLFPFFFRGACRIKNVGKECVRATRHIYTFLSKLYIIPK